MPGPVDNTLKHLTERSPRDWVIQGGWSAADATVIDADIATITGASDKVIRVAGAPDWLLAVDFQAGHDSVAKLPDLLLYNTALFRRHGLRVRTLLVVLNRAADSPQLSGLYERGFPDEPFDVALRYCVVRVWQIHAEHWLSGGLGLVPLAPLGDVAPDELPSIIARMQQRLEREAAPGVAAELWSAAYILMGLRYDRGMVQRLFQGVRAMKESVTYQAIIEEGEARGEARGEAKGEARGEARGEAKGKREEARRILRLLGRRQFGEPSAEAAAALDALTDVLAIEELTVRVQQAASWQELLGLDSIRRDA